jgi:hypothetical protein
VVRPLDRRRDARAVEVAARRPALSGGQLAAAQLLLAMITQATADDRGANRGDAIWFCGRLRLIATLHDPAVIRKLLAHLGVARSGPSPAPH